VKNREQQKAAFGASSHSGGSKVYVSRLHVLSLWSNIASQKLLANENVEGRLCINTKYFMTKKELRVGLQMV